MDSTNQGEPAAVPIDPASVVSIGIMIVATELRPEEKQELEQALKVSRRDAAQYLLPCVYEAIARQRPDHIVYAAFYDSTEEATKHASTSVPRMAIIMQWRKLTRRFACTGESRTYEIGVFLHYTAAASDLLVLLHPENRIVPRS